MQIVENPSEFASFVKRYRTQPSILFPVFSDHRGHPEANTLCLLGVFLMGDRELIGLPYNHSESTNLPVETLSQIWKSPRLYTPNARDILCIMYHHSIRDLQVLEYVGTGVVSDPDKWYTPTIRHFHEKFYLQQDVNRIIPLGVWMDHLQAYATHLLDIIEKNRLLFPESEFNFLNDAIPLFTRMEQNALRINPEQFNQAFPGSTRFIKDGKVYSEYNFFTSTGRPSCRHGGINYAALKKKGGQRESFISRFDNGQMVLIDFESYHVRLIAEQIGYELPPCPAHEYFARQYFDLDPSEQPTDEQYDESKTITFRNLYSDAPTEIPFFQRVVEFRSYLWKEILDAGFIETSIGKKKIRLEYIWDPSPAKVFNYFVQFLETERNIYLLQELMSLFDGKQSKLVLYNYDSFLIDFFIGDGVELIRRMIEILEQNGKFPVRIKYGKNYEEMKSLRLDK